MKLVIFGPQGSGKGTYASRIGPVYKIPHISTGDIFRESIKNQTDLGKKVEHFVKSGLLVPDEVTIAILKDRIGKPDARNGFILDGYPRTKEQAEALEKITKIDAVINLVVPEWVILERLAYRVSCEKCGTIYNLKTLKPEKEGICDKCGGKLIQRKDDTPEVIKERLKAYKEMSEPLIAYYKKKGNVIDIEVRELAIPPEEVVAGILKKLEKVKF